MRKATLLLVLTALILSSGCAQEKKLPAIKVVFMHYGVNDTHILKIKKAYATLITKDEAPTLHRWYDTPFPSITFYAYVFRHHHLVFVTPSTCLPITEEGDNLTTYVGFLDPKHVPQKGDGVLVVGYVYSKPTKKGWVKTLASSEYMFVWNLTWKP